MKSSLLSLTILSLFVSASCNKQIIEERINSAAIDNSVDIKEEVIQSIAPLGFRTSECTELGDNIFVRASATLVKSSLNIQFQSSYFSTIEDCQNGLEVIASNTTNYLIRKISLNSTIGTASSYNLDLMVLTIYDDVSNVEGLTYNSVLDQLDTHHTNYRKIGDSEYISFTKDGINVSFPFTYKTSGDSHAKRRSQQREISVVIPETEPAIFMGGGDLLIFDGSSLNDDM